MVRIIIPCPCGYKIKVETDKKIRPRKINGKLAKNKSGKISCPRCEKEFDLYKTMCKQKKQRR